MCVFQLDALIKDRNFAPRLLLCESLLGMVWMG